MKYDFSLKYGEGFTIFSQYSNGCCSVTLNAKHSDHFHWQGFIELEKARKQLSDTHFIAVFESRGSYRKQSSDYNNWIDPPKNHSLAGLVEWTDIDYSSGIYHDTKKVWGILYNGKPWFVDLKDLPGFVRDPNFEPPQVDNVVSMEFLKN